MLDDEQKRLIDDIWKIPNPDHLWPKYKWSKYNGDVACRLIAHYLGQHLGHLAEVVGPNVYVEGMPTEFDLLLVRRGAQPSRFTAAYPSSSIIAILEIRSGGIIDLKRVKKIRNNFDDVQKKAPINCIYLAITETMSTKKPTSINYLGQTKEGLLPYPVFCLHDWRWKQDIDKGLNIGEWGRLISLLKQLSSK